MTNLFAIVKGLLSEHSMVIVPGLGGFVVNEIGARLDKNTGRFYPPCAEIVFNVKLLHNDGMLVAEVSKTLSVSLDEANAQIDEEIKRINATLKSAGKVHLNGLGLLEKSGRNIIFHADANGLSCASSFGLSDFYFPELDEKEIEKRNSRYASPEKSIKGPIVAVASLLVLFFFSQSVHKESPASYQASLAFDQPCDWIRRDVHKDGKDVQYSVVIARFDSLNLAEQFRAENKVALSPIDSLEIMNFDQEYVVAFPTTKEWGKTIDRLQELANIKPDIAYPFILCREVE